MWFINPFHLVKAGRSTTRQVRRSTDRRQPATRRPVVETLEGRSLLASLAVGDVSLVEDNSGFAYAAVAVTLDTPSDKTVTVNYGTIDGTAIAGSDYNAVSGKLSFAPGQTRMTIQIPVRGDRLGESNETFAVKLQGAKNAKIADGHGVVTIVDNEPLVSISNAVVTEGNAGTALATLTVRLSAASDASVTVNYATADGVATAAGNDYTASSGMLTFAPGETSKSILIAVIGDRLHDEAVEDFSVNLSGVSANAKIANRTALVTIVDDEPRLSIRSAWAYEYAGYLNFTVTLASAYDTAVTVNFATRDGTAIVGEDYRSTSGTLTFAPGETSKTITVALYVDSNPEPTKNLYMVLSGVSANALIVGDIAVGEIYDTPDPIYGDLFGP